MFMRLRELCIKLIKIQKIFLINLIPTLMISTDSKLRGPQDRKGSITKIPSLERVEYVMYLDSINTYVIYLD